MKQITVNIYPFAELQPKVQQQVLEKYRYVEVEAYDWYQCEYEAFIQLCSLLGIDTSADQISFSGFYHQGAGSTFAAKINVLDTIKAVQEEPWKTASEIDLKFPYCPCQPRFIRQIENGNMDCLFFTVRPNRGNYISLWDDHRYSTKGNSDNIDAQLQLLSDWLQQVLDILNTHLFKSLETQYELLTSDETVSNYLTANEWLFTDQGTNANHLIR